MNKKILITYYSRTGNTRGLAEIIKAKVDGENEMNEIRGLDQEESLFFSHYSLETVEMLVNLK